MFDLVRQHIDTILVLLTGAGAWFHERNKRKEDRKKADNEIKQLETNNNKSIMDLYQEALDDLKKRYDEKFKELHQEMDALREKLKYSDQAYKELYEKYDSLKKTK